MMLQVTEEQSVNGASKSLYAICEALNLLAPTEILYFLEIRATFRIFGKRTSRTRTSFYSEAALTVSRTRVLSAELSLL